MNNSIRNINNDPTYYGLQETTKVVLDSIYPEFSVYITPQEDVFLSSDVAENPIEVEIELFNFKLGSETIIPDLITLNGKEVSPDSNNIVNVKETIKSSKVYDIEVTFNSKTTVKSKIINVVRPTFIGFSESNITSVSDFDLTKDRILRAKAQAFPIIKDEWKKVRLYNPTESYLWVASPSEILNKLPLGILEELKMNIEFEDEFYVYLKTFFKLNPGIWELGLHISGGFIYNYVNFNESTGNVIEDNRGINVNCIE